MSTGNSDSKMSIGGSGSGKPKNPTRITRKNTQIPSSRKRSTPLEEKGYTSSGEKSSPLEKKSDTISKEEATAIADKITPYILEKIYSIVGPRLDVKVIPYVLLLYVDFEKIKEKSPLKHIPQIKEIRPGKDNLDLGLVNGIFGVNSKRNYIIQLVYQEYCSKMFDTKEIETVTSSEHTHLICTNFIFDTLLRKYPDRKDSFDFPINQLIEIFVSENDDDPVLDINSNSK
jgi:hypothetical protein